MRKLILFLLVFVSAKVSAQVYQEMPQYGYRANRMAFDSTLQIPTVCGVPTLKSVVKTNKNGAIAYDSCNARFYAYNPKTQIWAQISGGSGGGVDSIRRVSDSVFAWISGIRFFQFKDSVGGGGISGTGSQYYVPKFSASTTLQNSQIFDSVNVGINTTSPAYKLDVNGTGRFVDDLYADKNLILNNYFTINTTATTFPLPDSDLGIWRKKDNAFGTKFIEDEQGTTKDKWAFVQRAGYDKLRDWTQNNSSIVNINYGWYKPNQSNLEGNTLLIDPKISIGDALITNTKIRGIYYNPTLDSLVNTTHIAFESASGNVVMKGLKTSSSTTDSIAIWINDTLSKAPYPSGTNSSDTAKVVIAQVHNETATTLLKGEIVYLFGSTGNVASVKRANNKTDATSSKTFGMVRRDIPSGGTGFITTQGQIEKLNLGSYAEGDVLWLDSIDGQFTKVKPQAPYHGVFLGIVERANAGNGLAYIKIQNGYELGEIHDVKLTSPINNQVLAYSDTQLVWKNRNITSLIDTTLFQRKSLSANTIMANNTNATANATAQYFKDTSGTYTGTITWNGTAPTSGTFSYRWTRIGKMVNLNISLVYANAGLGNTQVVVTLPADAPTPTKPAGLTSASNMLYPTIANVNITNQSTLTSATIRAMMRSNSGNNGFEFLLNFVSNNVINTFITCTYFTD